MMSDEVGLWWERMVGVEGEIGILGLRDIIS